MEFDRSVPPLPADGMTVIGRQNYEECRTQYSTCRARGTCGGCFLGSSRRVATGGWRAPAFPPESLGSSQRWRHYRSGAVPPSGGSSYSPSRRRSANRRRQLPTVFGSVPSRGKPPCSPDPRPPEAQFAPRALVFGCPPTTL